MARLSALLLVVPAIVYLFSVVGTRPILLTGYYWTRWIDPASLMLTVPFCLGWAIIVSGLAKRSSIIPGRFHSQGKYRILSVVVGGIGVAGLLWSIPSFSESFNDRRSHIASDSRAINIMNVQAGQWIYDHTSPGAIVGVNDAGAIRYFGQRRTIDLMGLNNADIAFDKVTQRQSLAQADWLAIFPSWFERLNLLLEVQKNFDQRMVIHIPLKEYTICDYPGQTTKVIFEKKKR